MKVLVVGLGAIGSIYATRLKDCAHDVRALLDENRLERYLKDGVYFNGKRYDFNYILASEKTFKPDLILVAVKYPSFVKLVKDIKNFVDKDVVILSLLNGISSEEVLRSEYPKSIVPISYYVGHASMRFGNKIIYDGVGKFVLEHNDLVEKLFKDCNIEYEVPDDIVSSMWQKFIINIGVNQTTAILKQPYGCFESDYARQIATGLMREGVEIAQKLGINGCDIFIEKAFEFIDNVPKTCKTSMMQDVENGNKTEVDIFAGEIIRLGRKLDVETPLNDFVYNILKSLE